LQIDCPRVDERVNADQLALQRSAIPSNAEVRRGSRSNKICNLVNNFVSIFVR
jgi:hypothetical protein